MQTWSERWEAKAAEFRENSELLDAAKRTLARAYLNGGDETWEEACDSVEAFIARQPSGISFAVLFEAIRDETARYADI